MIHLPLIVALTDLGFREFNIIRQTVELVVKRYALIVFQVDIKTSKPKAQQTSPQFLGEKSVGLNFLLGRKF